MYITIDGPEATGKSTTAASLVTRLRGAGYDVLHTKEPGSAHSRVCAQIRQMILSGTEPIDPTAEMLLFLADRVQHLRTVVGPALARGTIVVSDRSGITGLVYALAAEPDNVARHEQIKGLWRHGQVMWPDVAYIASADPDWSAEQLSGRANLDQIELRGADYHGRVRELYLRCLHPDFLGAPTTTKIVALPPTNTATTDAIVDFIMESM